MTRTWGTIYEYGGRNWDVVVIPSLRKVPSRSRAKMLGRFLLVISFFGTMAPLSQFIRLESSYITKQVNAIIQPSNHLANSLPPAIPVVFNPLANPDGSTITPINKGFSLIIPKIGVNAPVVADVDPGNPQKYDEVLQHAVAHAATSFLPDQNGTVYLFSHSTNYDWFAKDLNAVFYLLKNLDTGDTIVLYYQGKQYTYRLTTKKVVASSEVSYLLGQPGKKSLILQTCWPPGSTVERLLLFADLIEEQGNQI